MPTLSAEAKPRERINVYLDAEIRREIQRVGVQRGTSESATIRWLLGKSLDWWDGLSREQKETT